MKLKKYTSVPYSSCQKDARPTMPVVRALMKESSHPNAAPSHEEDEAAALPKAVGDWLASPCAVMATQKRTVGIKVVNPLPTSTKYPKDWRFAYDASNTE